MTKNLIILCLICASIVTLAFGYNYNTPNDSSRSSWDNKIVFENNQGSNSDMSAGDMVDINQQKVIVIVFLKYNQAAADMVPNSVNPNPGKNFLPEYEEYYKAYHTRMNNEIIKSINLNEYENIYISTHTPFVEYTYKAWVFDRYKETILTTLASNKNVSKIYIQNYQDNTNGNSMTNGIGIAGASSTYMSRAYTGDGIKVGVLELGVINQNHANFTNKSITVHDQSFFSETPEEHTTVVASIIGGLNGIAPDVEFYTSYLRGTLCEEVDWLINQGVDIINMSWNLINKNGIYGANSAYVDYTSRVYNRLFVISAGNMSETSIKVSDPALAYNGLTVGALDSERYVSVSSCYQVVDGPIKPTVMAKGVDLVVPGFSGETFRGTSFSTPIVTGLCALLMEKYPALKRQPMKIISLACANAKRTIADYYYDLDNNFDEYMGAGEFNFNNICNNYVNSIAIENATMAESGIVHYIDFTLDAGDTLQAAIAWFSYNFEDDTNDLKTDYDLKLMANNITYSIGMTTYNNVEMVNFTATTDNTYCTLIITQHSEQQILPETIYLSYNIS